MKVTYNWLKDFVEIKIPAQRLADKLTLAGLEVTSLEERDGDFVFEIEVTANRPDCLSVVGIAREAAAVTNSKLKSTVSKFKLLSAKRYPLSARNLQLKIEDKRDCPLYTAKVIKDVKVGPSPNWLKKRLELVGCRSVNNVVDITNYILFEWGQPLHAFDLDKLIGNTIIVRRGKDGEKITTIDLETRILNPDVLVIADIQRPQAIAGIMGGKDTQVRQDTKNILLEAAVFNPIIVRRARQGLGLQSESSYRFERGINPELLRPSSWQAAQLIQKICQAKFVWQEEAGLVKTKKTSILLNISSVSKILGTEIYTSTIREILNKLEFKTRVRVKDKLEVRVPNHRSDVKLEIDLIEELARIHGYEEIPKTLPYILPQITTYNTRDLSRPSLKYETALEEGRGLVSLIKNILVGLGLNEVITFSLINRDLLLKDEPLAITLSNPLSTEQGLLRPTLIPGLLRTVLTNLNQKQTYINIFELAKVFANSGGIPKEEWALGIALCGTHSLWSAAGMLKEEIKLLHLKGILETIFERLGIKDYNFNLNPNSQEVDIYVNRDKLGVMAQLAKSVLERFEIKNKEVFVLELFLERLFSHLKLKKKFMPLPLYPGIFRDISLILKEDTRLKPILKTIKELGKPLLKETKIIDYYRGRQIPPGHIGLTISCLYRLDERTLTEEEVEYLHSQVLKELTQEFSVQIRA